MNKDELFDKYTKIIDNGKEETEKWILSLSDEEFNELVKFPIIVQAKIYYKKLRDKKENK